jgi:hypothetical protein
VRRSAAALAVLLLGCRRTAEPGLSGLDVAGCRPVQYGSVTGAALRADAPALTGGRRYHCLVFPGTAEHRVQLTVFADGFEPGLYLLDPSEAPHRLLAWDAAGSATGVVRTSVRLPRTRPYAAVVTAEAGAGGTFLLSVQDHP